MWKVQKSDLFIKQLSDHAHYYKRHAGKDIAQKFLRKVGEAIIFIQSNPMACRVYQEAAEHSLLRGYEFRRWNVAHFPYSIFFRLEENRIILEVIYAHRMNILKRFSSDLDRR